MAVRYFCDRCDKERDTWMINVNLQGREFKGDLCEACIEELKDILKIFFEIPNPTYNRE